MQIENNSIQGRINKLQETFQKKLEVEKVCQGLIDLTLSRPFVKANEEGKVEISITHYDWVKPTLTFTVSEVNLSDFIEGVLGVLHRWKGYNWEMAIEGDEEDPVFIFTPIGIQIEFDFRFRVKEGIFKSCTIVRRVKTTYRSSYESHEYDYEMECM